MERESSKAPASAWPPWRASFNGMAGGSGPKRRLTRGRRSISAWSPPPSPPLAPTTRKGLVLSARRFGARPPELAGPGLLAEPLEPVRQFRAPFSLVCQLGDEQRERLGVAGHFEGTGVHRIETHVADQLGGHALSAPVIPAVHEAWSGGVALGLEHAEEHFAGYR